MKSVLKAVKSNKKFYQEKLFEALRIPSVTDLPEYKKGVRKMAEWLKKYLGSELKFQAQLIETSANPLVYAESPKIEGAPTVLVYGHYDVQPPEPLEKWRTPPFEPVIRGGRIVCRGSADDKGQFMTHVFSTQAWLSTKGALPFQLKFILEGNEEAGSEGLSKFLTNPDNCDLLKTDVIVVSDTSMLGADLPSINYGLRGVTGFILTLHGPDRDVHSGVYGGSISNPAIVLSKILGEMIDQKGVIKIPGFYDNVQKLTAKDRAALSEVPNDEKRFLADIGLTEGFGDSRYTPVEQRSARPSFDINGLTSGYQGPGGKTIIPSEAVAKFTFRLVPNQDPAQIAEMVRKFVEARIPAGIKMELQLQQGSGGMLVSLDSPYIKLAAAALEETFGRKPYFTREGGSIPIVAELQKSLHADVLLIGFGLNEDGIHSPNESFALKSFHSGIETSVRLWQKFGELAAQNVR